MSVLVTGGAGFIGTALARRLTQLDIDVVLLDLPGRFKAFHRAVWECLELDVSNWDQLKVLSDRKFTTVFHLAAQTSSHVSQLKPELDVDTNVKGVLNVLNLCRRASVEKIVFTSSVAVYGSREGKISETDPLLPVANYGCTKVAGEAFIRCYGQYGIKHTIFRLFNVYGPGQDYENLMQGMLSIYMAQAITNGVIRMTGSMERYRDFVYIDDVVDALLMAMSGLHSLVLNVGTGNATRVQELVEVIGKLEGRDIFVENIGSHEGDIFGSVADISSIKEQGWSPSWDIGEGIVRMYADAREALR